MLGRRQIREKVVETLYAYHQNPLSFDILEKNMMREIDKVYELYVYELNFLLALRDLAEHQQEIAKNKFLKTENDLHPNEKFIQNRALAIIADNTARKEFTAKHKNIRWELDDDLLVKTYQRLTASKRYQDYMRSDEDSFLEDQKFIGKIYLKFVAENEDFLSWIEEQEINWYNDFHIANSMVQKTLGFLTEDPGPQSHTLLSMIKNDEDEKFARSLLRHALNSWEESEEKVKIRLKNWELDRVSLMDRIILIAAISELDHYPTTPTRIIINEYIEIAKTYATEKSNIFVNGILDNYTKETNRI